MLLIIKNEVNKMVERRKPISFDTTLRNPERISGFISILDKFNGQIIDDRVALALEAEIIRQKIFKPTKNTLGKYVKYNKKLNFVANDLSESARQRVNKYYKEWDESDPGGVESDKIVYLLQNTFTSHKEKGWQSGWESRISTQFKFLNELGFVQVIKNKKIKISPNGKMMIKCYENGRPKDDGFDESYEQSAFLNAFAKYQINNPYRKNTVKVNFFPLVLHVIKYLDEKYDRPGISKQDLPFIITWGSNDYETLSEYIYHFRKKFGYNTSDELVYQYAMNLMDDKSNNDVLAPASDTFIESKKKDYKFSKIISETPDEVIRKLRLTMLISLRGAGRFIDLNRNENDKIEFVLNNYSLNRDFDDDYDKYMDFMGKTDQALSFNQASTESQDAKDAKEQAIENWASSLNWDELKEEMINSIDKKASENPILKYIKETARLEFLSAIVIKKALPRIKVVANYKADDQGIPFGTASGGNNQQIGADIDVFEDKIHAIVEPTVSKARSFQVEHEIPSIRRHVLATAEKDMNDNSQFNEFFSIFVASNITRDVGDQTAIIKSLNKVEIFPWEVKDFVDFSKDVNSIKDYKIIRKYAEPQQMPNM